MLRHSVIAVLVLLIFPAFHAKDSYRRVSQTSFGAGEHFEYRVHYGIFNAADAVVDVNPQIQYVNGRPCYKISIVGTTLGAFSWFAKVRDEWQSWMDTSAIVSQKFHRNIQENNYRKVETTVFNHSTDDAIVTDENGTKNLMFPTISRTPSAAISTSERWIFQSYNPMTSLMYLRFWNLRSTS